MKRKMLNKAQERWLFKNYSSKSNIELSEELTKMVLEEYQNEAEKLESELEDATSYNERLRIVNRLKVLKSFKRVSIPFIKKKAIELGCEGKTPMCVSRINRQKAENTYWNRIMPSAVFVSTPYEWFNSFKLEEQKVARLEDQKKYKSMRISIWNWNHDIGSRKGIVLVPRWNQNLLAVKVVAKSLYK